ncbi:hypothetical protein [Bacillus fonticola]|uniref:hypothetical protein n=1 Tax=Bacillus fonticola TaxID=2728853 RepID=UPI0014756747|nr:hypothetical protein [Bacillus fonticola]
MNRTPYLVVLLLILWVFLPVRSLFAEEGLETWDVRQIKDNQKEWIITFSKSIRSKSTDAKDIYIVNDQGKIHPTELQFTNSYQTARVVPLAPYEPRRTYELIVNSSVRASNWDLIEKGIIQPFRLFQPSEEEKAVSSPQANERDTALDDGPLSNNELENEGVDEEKKGSDPVSEKPIQREKNKLPDGVTVTLSSTSYFETMEVVALQETKRVAIDGKFLQYIGNNTFRMSSPSLQTKDIVTLTFYNVEDQKTHSFSYKLP